MLLESIDIPEYAQKFNLLKFLLASNDVLHGIIGWQLFLALNTGKKIIIDANSNIKNSKRWLQTIVLQFKFKINFLYPINGLLYQLF